MRASAPARSPGPAAPAGAKARTACQGPRCGRCGAASARATKEAPSANGRARSPTLVACSAGSLCWAGAIAAQRRGAHPSASRRQQALCAATKQAAHVLRLCAARAAETPAARDTSLRQARDRSLRALTSGATFAPAALARAARSRPMRGPLPDAGRRGLRASRHAPTRQSRCSLPLTAAGPLPGAPLQDRCLLALGRGEQPRPQSCEPRGLRPARSGRSDPRLPRPRLPVARPGHAGALRSDLTRTP